MNKKTKRKKKNSYVIFKLDVEKVYGLVDWSFLQATPKDLAFLLALSDLSCSV